MNDVYVTETDDTMKKTGYKDSGGKGGEESWSVFVFSRWRYVCPKKGTTQVSGALQRCMQTNPKKKKKGCYMK